MKKILCKEDFFKDRITFKKGIEYFYWSNFGGMNHFVSDEPYSENNKNIIPFDGERLMSDIIGRPYLYDFFYTDDEYRDIKINKILNN